MLGSNRDPATMVSFMESEPIGRPVEVAPEAVIEV